jgi:3-mercaptopyruvate sulfurtransferase SseA
MSTGFGQSCRGYVLLRYLGYPKVRVLHGGYAAWVAAGCRAAAMSAYGTKQTSISTLKFRR